MKEEYIMRRKLWLPACMTLSFALGWTVGWRQHVSPAANQRVPAVYFSPGGGAREAILGHIRGAREEIVLALYYFTDPGMAEALAEAKERGVTVTVLLDRSQRRGRHSQAFRLRDMGVSVRFDSRHRILHHKFMVVDGRTLITGSQNWTRSAETVNAENTLIHVDNPVLAGRFRSEFHRLAALGVAE